MTTHEAAQNRSSDVNIAALYEDVEHFLEMTKNELYGLDPVGLQKLQLHHLRKRFAEMRPQIAALDRLATSTGTECIEQLDDVVALCFPHTIYKGYSVADVEKGRYDRLTRWLDTLTALDLSVVDLDGCASLEDWLTRIEEQTDLRPATSSGTSGKISVFPRGQYEEEHGWWALLYHIFTPFGEERGMDILRGDVPLLTPWPNDKGRHNMPVIFRIFRERVYGGREDMVLTLSKDRVTATELWLAGRVQRAQSRGEELILSDFEKETMKSLAARNAAAGQRYPEFVRKAVVEQKGKKVIIFGAWFQVWNLYEYCRDNDIKIEWAPDSIVWSGGGTKGYTFPDGWREELFANLPVKYPDDVVETYSSTEYSAGSYRCSQDKLHPMPWGVPFVLDPDTGEPLPREGTVTGRAAGYDLLSKTYWGGSISGDEVTMHWDGGCECGRIGPFYDNNVRRYTETRAGDDKITCAKTPGAYEELSTFALTV